MEASRYFRIALYALLAAVMVDKAAAFEDDQLRRGDLERFKPTPHRTMAPHHHKHDESGRGLPIDSVDNWIGHYFADGVDEAGNSNRVWYTNTVGEPPEHGGIKLIHVPIVPVIMDLRNEDGSPRFVNGQPLVSSPEAFIGPVLRSPIFAYSHWSSSAMPTQFIDAFQRASYFSSAKHDWHTLLVPSVKRARRMTLNKGSYFFALNDDGSCCLAIIVDQPATDKVMFPTTPTDTITVMGAAENAGDITTKDISVFLFYNTILTDFINGGLFVGYHSWDFEPADSGGKNKYYVMAWVNWISHGLFLPPFDTIEDIATLSHELAEVMNEPFPVIDPVFDIDPKFNRTPWWLGPNGFCADRLEVGDGLALLPNSIFPITMNGMTYHVQNMTLVPWFKREFPSSALHNAYTYPDETVMTTLSPPEKMNCQ